VVWLSKAEVKFRLLKLTNALPRHARCIENPQELALGCGYATVGRLEEIHSQLNVP
jgi:hypothetical protein